MLQSSIGRLSGSVARPKARQRCSLAGNSSVAQRVRQRNATRVCRASGSPTDPPPPADDSSSSNPASSSPASGESAEPSTSYLLPWEDEQPKQLPANYEAIKASILQMDNNQLQTALAVAIAAEDYALASRIKERLQQKLAESGSAVVSKPMDWAALGVPEWLADRAERLGFLFPTEVQRRSTPVILSGADTVIASETGSGKTAACLVPALSQLDYPPQLFPEDLEGPQLLLLVPSFELGVQACLLLFKLWGGNISSRSPGDPANMFSYTGPAGIKVRGVLNDEEVQMAVAGRYLQGVHALVATPDMALALLSLPDSPLSFQDLRVIVVDEMDALLDAYPASFGQLMDAAVHRAAPSSSSSGGADAAAAAAAAAASGDPSRQSGTAQDNMAKLTALLERQQQQEQEKQQRAAGDAAAAAAAAAGSASMAAAAARLEGLLAAPAAAGADEQQPEQQQQQENSSAAAGEQASSEQQQQQQVEQLLQQQQQLQQLQAEAAALEDDTPMPKPQVVLVGATVSDNDITLALNRGWVEEPVLVRVGTAGNVPAGLKHRAVVVAGNEKRLGGLVSSLRKDLTDALAAADAAAAAAAAASHGNEQQPGQQHQQQQQQHAAPVRVIVFATSEVDAQRAAEPLRAALWGDHMLSVLLPSTGAEPIKALHAFRDRVASLLLATPSAARGLDLPAVSHVYSLGLPPDATDYVHRAGRAGRIGSTAGGEICTVVTREELPALQKMVEEELGLQLECVDLERQGLGLLGSEYDAARQGLLQEGEEEQGEEQQGQGQQQGMEEKQLENARKGLEDLFNLL